VPSLFRRKSTELVAEPVAEEVTDSPSAKATRGYTPKKGEATPKRPVANRRVVEAVPTNRKEAAARSRAKAREDRAEQRIGMMNGDDRFLTARDKGPVRRYVRDIVDARHNVGSIFFFGTIAVLVLSMIPIFTLQLGSNLAFLTMLVAIVIDSVLLARRIRQRVSAKFPKHSERWGQLYFYGVMRALSFRKMRAPKPQVKVGDKV
jgi:DUF3043 family protein